MKKIFRIKNILVFGLLLMTLSFIFPQTTSAAIGSCSFYCPENSDGDLSDTTVTGEGFNTLYELCCSALSSCEGYTPTDDDLADFCVGQIGVFLENCSCDVGETFNSDRGVCLTAGARPDTPVEEGSEEEGEETEEKTATQKSSKTKKVSLTNPLGTTSIPDIIGRIIRGLLGIVGSIALLMFVYGGFTLLTSGGSSDKVKKGKDILVWATIGIVFIFISFLSVNFIINSLTGLSDEEETEKTSSVGPCTTRERESGGRCLCNGSRAPHLSTSGDCASAGCSWSVCE